MQWNDAIDVIQGCGARMTALFGAPVFDEWAILKLNGVPSVAYYSGPRPSEFMATFARDSAALSKEAGGRPYSAGEFEFARDSAGTAFDAFPVLGGGCILVCNNIRDSMTEIRANPSWLKAQVPFVELTERFRADPLKAE
jgi:hypothetical protein